MGNKVALVTGGTKGIGLEVAKELQKLGYKTVINYFNDDASAKKAENLYGFKAYKADVSNKAQVLSMIKTIEAEQGDICVLVNCAGIAPKQKLMLDFDEEEFDRVFAVNVKGTFLVTQQVLPKMISNRFGIIINISSVFGEIGASCEVCYASTKGAINAMTKSLAKEFCHGGIRVNAIAPGLIDTDMNSHLSPQDKQDFCDQLLVQRVGLPKDIAIAVRFLIENTYVTGAIIPVDGGII